MIFTLNKKKNKSFNFIILILLIGSIILSSLKGIEIYRNKQDNKQINDFIEHWEKFEKNMTNIAISDDEIPQRAYDIHDLIVNKGSLTEISSYKKELDNISLEMSLKNKKLLESKHQHFSDIINGSKIESRRIKGDDRKLIDEKLDSAWDKFFNKSKYRSANEDLESVKSILSKYMKL